MDYGLLERKWLDEEELTAEGPLAKLINKDLPQDDPKQRKPDITKAKTLLNWEPKVKLEDGLTKTIDWVSSQL